MTTPEDPGESICLLILCLTLAAAAVSGIVNSEPHPKEFPWGAIELLEKDWDEVYPS